MVEEFSIPRPRLSGGGGADVCATAVWALTNMRIVKASQNRKGLIEDVKAFFMMWKEPNYWKGCCQRFRVIQIPRLELLMKIAGTVLANVLPGQRLYRARQSSVFNQSPGSFIEGLREAHSRFRLQVHDIIVFVVLREVEQCFLPFE